MTTILVLVRLPCKNLQVPEALDIMQLFGQADRQKISCLTEIQSADAKPGFSPQAVSFQSFSVSLWLPVKSGRLI